MTHTSAPSDDEIVDAYLYLFGRLLVARQEKFDIDVEKVGWNTIKYNPLGSAESLRTSSPPGFITVEDDRHSGGHNRSTARQTHRLDARFLDEPGRVFVLHDRAPSHPPRRLRLG